MTERTVNTASPLGAWISRETRHRWTTDADIIKEKISKGRYRVYAPESPEGPHVPTGEISNAKGDRNCAQ